ncbi:membrane protein insertase YidC [bacterium]|nr:membrane protein insertase YidC [bacterium]
MDRKSIVLVVILALVVLFYWQILDFLGIQKQEPPKQTAPVEQTESPQQQAVQQQDSSRLQSGSGLPDLLTDTSSFGRESAPEMLAETVSDSMAIDSVIVTTDMYQVTLISKGGGPVSILLREQTYRDGELIEMLPEPMNVAPEASFANGAVMTGDLPFESSLSPGTYAVTGDEFTIDYTFQAPNGVEIVKHYIFYPDKYSYDMVLTVRNSDRLGIDLSYELVWNNPPPITEPDAKTDFQEMNAVAMIGGARKQLDDYDDGSLNQTESGTTTWAGVRSKYFAGVLIPRSQAAEGAHATGRKWKASIDGSEVEVREPKVALQMPLGGRHELVDSFTVFVGPMDYFLMSSYDVGLEDMLGIGTTPFVGWIIKPFALAVMWALPIMYSVISNYGIVIILFSLLIKIITMPLSLKSFKSMQAMKDLQPKIEELKKKYQKNPQAMNQEMMKLYKKHGVNPMSGCLPILLQMPLLFAMFSVFRATILLRDAPFFWFIQDLSHGATGFTDPYISLVIIMVGAQFLSQHLTMASSTQQNKALMYVMPLMMGFFLYSLPAGLILYWICFSVFSLLDWLVYRKPKNPEVQTA